MPGLMALTDIQVTSLGFCRGYAGMACWLKLKQQSKRQHLVDWRGIGFLVVAVGGLQTALKVRREKRLVWIELYCGVRNGSCDRIDVVRSTRTQN